MDHNLADTGLDNSLIIADNPTLICESLLSPTLCVGESGDIVYANQDACDLSGYSLDEIANIPINKLFTTSPVNKAITIEDLNTRQGEKLHLLHKNGGSVPVEYRISRDQDLDYYFVTIIDFSCTKTTEQKLTVQLERMQSLGNIDRAIISSMDLSFITNMVFDQINSQLNMECSLLFMQTSNRQQLKCQYSRGLSLLSGNGTRNNHPKPVIANQVVASGMMVIIENPSTDPLYSVDNLPFPYDELKFYAGIPLRNLGETIGVLEIGSTKPFSPDSDWKNFFKVVAGQTAIAIAHITQFHNIRRLNAELLKSYESTLEGWARVLEFKDRETKGHSDRVTKMAVKLGEAMGLSAEEIVHLRRGAVLHDIGKLCIPEKILFKNGPLDAAEWDVMKQHPIYAQEFIADIQFLQPVTNILLFHHERWDGSGYPFGLKNKQIPLAARIFMVIDVWDALSFNRPYRKAWPAEKVRQYIKENAGILFDPEVIEIFLELIS